MEVDWTPMLDLVATTRSHPERFTPWLRIYLERHSEQIFV
jgi:isopentenyl-diphosphate delta-isomerase